MALTRIDQQCARRAPKDQRLRQAHRHVRPEAQHQIEHWDIEPAAADARGEGESGDEKDESHGESIERRHLGLEKRLMHARVRRRNDRRRSGTPAAAAAAMSLMQSAFQPHARESKKPALSSE